MDSTKQVVGVGNSPAEIEDSAYAEARKVYGQDRKLYIQYSYTIQDIRASSPEWMVQTGKSFSASMMVGTIPPVTVDGGIRTLCGHSVETCHVTKCFRDDFVTVSRYELETYMHQKGEGPYSTCLRKALKGRVTHYGVCSGMPDTP